MLFFSRNGNLTECKSLDECIYTCFIKTFRICKILKFDLSLRNHILRKLSRVLIPIVSCNLLQYVIPFEISVVVGLYVFCQSISELMYKFILTSGVHHLLFNRGFLGTPAKSINEQFYANLNCHLLSYHRISLGSNFVIPNVAVVKIHVPVEKTDFVLFRASAFSAHVLRIENGKPALFINLSFLQVRYEIFISSRCNEK